jgi:ubiquinone/menaquinone biosynthesis C-methylase UbiE
MPCAGRNVGQLVDKMDTVQQRLQRAFWSLYGRFVWDARKEPWKSPQVRQIVQIVEARRVTPGERVLDAGCGTGNYTLALAEVGFHVVGVDYAKGMIARAWAKVADGLAGEVSFQQANLNQRLDFPDAHFDHVISISVLQVMTDPVCTLRELWRVLKPNGTLVLLHVPRPDCHNLPLGEAIRYRTRALQERTLWTVGLTAVKVWAERSGKARYWTVPELRDMLRAGWFSIRSVNHGPPTILVAEKEVAKQSAATK